MNALEHAQQILTAQVQEWQSPESQRLDAYVESSHLLEAVKTLFDGRWGYLVAITGLDCGVETGDMEVLYHFCAGAAVLTLRVKIAREQAAVPSICATIPCASVFERELAEMFGIEVRDTPDPSRLFLPDDWPEGVYPLRKDAALE
ncbi:MAG: NADH-quinone oxidoreductase subunit C [Anaerolineae bacterium]|nr:NADH-quinone oxidoreductase subunit C [Anaerolineae bacterium]